MLLNKCGTRAKRMFYSTLESKTKTKISHRQTENSHFIHAFIKPVHLRVVLKSLLFSFLFALNLLLFVVWLSMIINSALQVIVELYLIHICTYMYVYVQFIDKYSSKRGQIKVSGVYK